MVGGGFVEGLVRGFGGELYEGNDTPKWGIRQWGFWANMDVILCSSPLMFIPKMEVAN